MTDPVLTVADVMALYHLADRRSARKVMNEAGGFIVGQRLLVRQSVLLAHEERLRAMRRPPGAPPSAPRGRRRGRSEPDPRIDPATGLLKQYWWREEQ